MFSGTAPKIHQQLVAEASWYRRQDVIGRCPGRLCDRQSSGEPQRQGDHDAMRAIVFP